MEIFENIFKPASIFYNGYKFNKNTPRASLFNIIFAQNTNKQNVKLVDGQTISIMSLKNLCKSRGIFSEDVRREAARKIEEKAPELDPIFI
ncbi:LOW QUALITY PROTEIN: hypothetical protein HZS_3858 [Henneguya salminicola]|nr:LOW QUALITY PROTEIN: hypothetical protein HZS_3858 [Henneguya salminicola]